MKTKDCDIFLCYSAADTAWAAEVERAFLDAGFSVFSVAGIKLNKASLQKTRKALEQSAALVALVGGNGPNEWFSFEVGAAMGLDKPAYALFKGRRPVLTSYVEQFGVFPASKIDRLIALISDAEAMSRRGRLNEAYA